MNFSTRSFSSIGCRVGPATRYVRVGLDLRDGIVVGLVTIEKLGADHSSGISAAYCERYSSTESSVR